MITLKETVDLKKQEERRRQQMLLDYSEVLSRLTFSGGRNEYPKVPGNGLLLITAGRWNMGCTRSGIYMKKWF